MQPRCTHQCESPSTSDARFLALGAAFYRQKCVLSARAVFLSIANRDPSDGALVLDFSGSVAAIRGRHVGREHNANVLYRLGQNYTSVFEDAIAEQERSEQGDIAAVEIGPRNKAGSSPLQCRGGEGSGSLMNYMRAMDSRA